MLAYAEIFSLLIVRWPAGLPRPRLLLVHLLQRQHPLYHLPRSYGDLAQEAASK